MKNNRISVVLPTFGRDELFKNALHSILNQENSNWELIIINDGNVNVKQYIPLRKNIIYIKNASHMGAAASRNIGIRASSNDFIAYIDDDDEWLPNHLTLSSDLLNDYDFIYSGTQLRKRNEIIQWYNEDFSYRKLAERNIITTPSVIHKKKLLNASGFWDERLKCLQDWDMWCRMLLKTDRIYHREDVTVIINSTDYSITTLSANTKLRKRTTAYIKYHYYFPLLWKHLRKGRSG